MEPPAMEYKEGACLVSSIATVAENYSKLIPTSIMSRIVIIFITYSNETLL